MAGLALRVPAGIGAKGSLGAKIEGGAIEVSAGLGATFLEEPPKPSFGYMLLMGRVSLD